MVCYFSGLTDLLSAPHSVTRVSCTSVAGNNSAEQHSREHSACDPEVTSGLLNLVFTDIWGQTILCWGEALSWALKDV